MSDDSNYSYFKRRVEMPDGVRRGSPDLRTVIENRQVHADITAFKRAFERHLKSNQGTDAQHASHWDMYMALSYTVRDCLMDRWIRSAYAIRNQKSKMVCYLSAEFLLGKQLHNNLLHVGCMKPARATLEELGHSIYDVFEQEAEPGLGNGGLGRLAACYLDSMATLNIPSFGYGIRYEFGIFEQAIQDGWQVEKPDKWLRYGSPWEIQRPQLTREVGFGGHTEMYRDNEGRERRRWVPNYTVLGIPYDMMVPGFNTDMVNTLRLWSAGTSNDFDFRIFNDGEYLRAVESKARSENISKVLYPNDNIPKGRKLRLQQQYFFVSCSLQDMIRRHQRRHGDLSDFHDRNAVQLNDTHPSIAVPELMRLLMDEHCFSWDQAWAITTKTFGYTNHTLLSEALECWPVRILGELLPRHLEIIYEINQRFLDAVNIRFPGDGERRSRMSIIEEGVDKKIRMAHLATVGSHAVNGVADLHTELLKKDLLRDFYEYSPEKFSNKTNGITPRRWMLLANPKLAFLITEKIGDSWITNLEELQGLESSVRDPAFLDTWLAFKTENKRDLAEHIRRFNGVKVDPDSLFDIQVKRLHEYKRQLLNIMHVIALYNRIRANPNVEITPRTVIFGAKAAPGYFMAKLIIKLINSVGEVVNQDPVVRDRLKVVFLKNFCVTLGEATYPAADLSEQISLAGKEASGTGNMKFTLNGALTIGTLDGANVEIREAVGAENFFLFGLTVDQVNKLRAEGYCPRTWYERDPELRGVLDALTSGMFSQGDRELYLPLVHHLLERDEYMHLADFRSYMDCQENVSRKFQDKNEWTRMAILNVARAGKFSSDRSILEYCRDIWNADSIVVKD